MYSTDNEFSLQDRNVRRDAQLKDRPLEMEPVHSHNTPHGNIPNTPLAAATISFLLGGVFTLGFLLFCAGGFSLHWWTTYQLGFFVAAWAAFHYGEFAVTAGWNREKCSVDSFLLDNGVLYHVANGIALLEYLITLFFKPSLKEYPYLSSIGIVMTLVGQVLRSTAMIHASTNFSHTVAFYKVHTHQLVTDGIYAWLRHPSYTGFFYWGLGTQLVLQNPVSFVLYAFLLWRFFSRRIKAEEAALVKFFGEDYTRYRSRVGTMIPFIP